MTTTFNLAPLPLWTIFDNQGKFASNGRIYTYQAINHDLVKVAYQDQGGTIPFEIVNGKSWIPLNDFGQAPPFYLASDANYFLVITYVINNIEQIIWTIDNFNAPNAASGSPITNFIDPFNHILNPQLEFPLLIPSPLPANNMVPILEGGWEFIKSNTNATDSIQIVPFILGQTDVPGQPANYFQYQCTAVGAGGETQKIFRNRLCRVTGFNNDTISTQFYFKSNTSSIITVSLRQHFGTGGSPSPDVVTPLVNVTANSLFVPVPLLGQAVPSVAGKTLGTNGDDALYLEFNLPLNQISEIGLTQFQFVHGNIVPALDHQTDEYIGALCKGNDLPFRPQNISPARGQAIIIAEDGTLQFGIPAALGEIKMLAYDATENVGIWKGWLKINSNVLRILTISTYPDLFALLSNVWGGDGTTTFALPPLGDASIIAQNTVSPTRLLGSIGGGNTQPIAIANLPPISGGYVVNVGAVLDSNSGSHLGIVQGGGIPLPIKNPFCVMCAMIKF